MWYLAIYLDCQPILPQPFRDKAERDAWASTHEEATDHMVVRSMPNQVQVEYPEGVDPGEVLDDFIGHAARKDTT
jgi:hypothetical protein